MSLTSTDLRILCTALGFTAIVVHGENIPKKEGDLRAAKFARLIEAFCHETLPEIFGAAPNPQADEKFATAKRMADAIVELYDETGGCLPQDLAAKGFTHEEIDRYWAMAKALAHVEMKFMGS